MDLATPVVLTNQQAGWVKLSLYKKNLFESLQRSELAVQAKLIPRPSDMAALQAAIKEAKSIASQAKADRLEFTRLIEDKLTKPSMEYEKRMDALIEEASSEELAIRKAERDKEMQAQKKEDEKARFKAFVQNEYVRIQADYKMRLRNAADFAYRTALKAVVKGEKEKWIEDTEKTMRKYTLSEFRKFDLQLLSKEEAKDIYTSIPAYDATPDLDSELFRMRGFFDNLDIEIEHAE